MLRLLVWWLVAAVPAPAPSRPQAPAATVQATEMDEAAWLAQVAQRLSQRWKAPPQAFRFSPDRSLAVFVPPPPPVPVGKNKRLRKPPRPRPFTIVVVDVTGRLKRRIRPLQLPGGVEPPQDLRFLGDHRLVYQVVAPPPPPPPRRKRGQRAPAAPPEPVDQRQLLVIHPARKAGRPVRCLGTRFAFTAAHDRLAYVAGPPPDGRATPAGDQFIAVDGRQVYPRGRGRTTVASDLGWSKEGLALAFVEIAATTPGDKPQPQLVLLADLDNSTGDTRWPLPPAAAEPMHIFWVAPDKIVVGKSVGKPIFTASFQLERPR